MKPERIEIETKEPTPLRWRAALARFIRQELAYHELVRELSQLTPELLADIQLQRSEIRRFAWAATHGKAPRLAEPDDGPMTTIGSRDWARAYLLRLGSN